MKPKTTTLQNAVLSMTRSHFAFVGLYMLSIIIFDSWNLIAHEGIVWRWQAASALLILNAICWYMARTTFSSRQVYKLTAFALIVADAIFASMNVYWQRGMASPLVILFAVPIVAAAVLHSRRAIWAAASVSVAAYSYTAVRYFHLHYGEGLKVELYGHVILFCGIFYILALFLTIIIKPQVTSQKSK